MSDKSKDTQKEIAHAARSEFLSRGYEGARLQNIADHIGVTKAMIHYYFNTKKELFEHVYRESVDLMFRGLSDIMDADLPLFKKMEQLVSACMDKAESDPEVLGFILTESSRNSDWLIPIFEEQATIDTASFADQIEEAASNYVISSVDPNQVLLNIFSLCYYPALSMSINRSLFADGSGESSDAAVAMKNREGIVLDTLLNWLTA